jgi:hypothetical protein
LRGEKSLAIDNAVEVSMKNTALSALPLLLVLAGCELAGDIFQAGIWVGVLLVLGIVALAVWMFSKAKH